MIAFLKGLLYSVQQNRVVLDVNGVGYNVLVPLSVVNGLPCLGSEVMLYTHQQLREDGISLYGFDSEESLALFRLLLGVSGVGPKGALGVLSVVGPENFYAAITADNVSLISRAPGIGKKTAQRIILDLKDKINKTETPTQPMAEEDAAAVEALLALGYRFGEASAAMRTVTSKTKGKGMPVEVLIKEALKYLGHDK